MYSGEHEPAPDFFPLRNPGSVPIPDVVERAEMRSVLLRHQVVNQRCRSCGHPTDRIGFCWFGRVAFERLASSGGRGATS